jgi:hypothetical protein
MASDWLYCRIRVLTRNFHFGNLSVMAASSGGFPCLFFALMMVVQFFVVLWWYPEAKEISLEQMQKKMGIA